MKPTLLSSLKCLKLDHVDLYLIHWPDIDLTNQDVEPTDEERERLIEVWKEMEAVCNKKLATRIGLCNFSPTYIKPILDTCKIRPAVNQIGVHLYQHHQKTVQFCKKEKIHVTSHSPFGTSYESKVLLTHPTVVSVANDLKADPGQVLINWTRQTCDSVVFKSPTKSYIKTNSTILDIPLDKMEKLNEVRE